MQMKEKHTDKKNKHQDKLIKISIWSDKDRTMKKKDWETHINRHRRHGKKSE